MAKPWEKYGNAGGGAVVTPLNPYASSDERRKEEDQAIQRERLRISQENANRQAAESALARQEKQQKIDTEQSERDQLERAQASGMSDSLYQIQDVLSAAKKAKEMAKGGAGIGSWEGGDSFRDSNILSILGANQSSFDMQALLNTIGSNTAFDRLSRMRQESKTGGALGAVSEIELRLLRDSIASLSQTQSDEQFQQNIQKVIDAYQRVGAKLNHANQYYRNSGSMEGYTPPSDDELNKFSVDPDRQDAAEFGATEQRVNIPPAMQAEWDDYTQRNWGRLDPQQYAQFRAGLDSKYGFGDNDPSVYASEADRLNETAIQGGVPGAMPIPPAIEQMSDIEQLRHNTAVSGPGTLASTYANAASLGLPNLIDDGQLDAMREENPWWAAGGDILGGVTGAGLTGKGLGMAASKLGGRAGTITANPITADAAYGTIFGATEADDPVLGALVGSTGALAGNYIGGQIGKRLPFGKPADPLTGGERAVVQTAGDIDPVLAALSQADELGVPMALADASPELASIAGSATRFSPKVAGDARSVMAQRNQGQMDRLGDAVTRDLGPIENIPQRSEDLLAQARQSASPLYEQAYAAPGASSVQIDDLMQRPSFKDAIKEAFAEAADEGVDPRSLGFDLDEAGEILLTKTPSWQTLDYAKRGLDNIIERETSAIDGVSAAGRRAIAMKNDLLKRMDKINPTYAEARAAYAGPAAEREFLKRGGQASKILPNQLGVDVGKLTPQQRAQMQLGFQSNIMDTAGNLRNNSNPWAQLNTPNTEGRLGALYGDEGNIANLLTQRDLELQLAGSANRLTGNSATAERAVADEFFKQQPGMAGDVTQGIAETALLGGPWLTVGKRVGDRMFKDRREASALAANRQLADEIGPLLLNTDPASASKALTDLSVSDEAYQAILDELLKRNQGYGGHVGAGAVSGGIVGSGGF